MATHIGKKDQISTTKAMCEVNVLPKTPMELTDDLDGQ
jgi:hypothetical protein